MGILPQVNNRECSAMIAALCLLFSVHLVFSCFPSIEHSSEDNTSNYEAEKHNKNYTFSIQRKYFNIDLSAREDSIP